MKNIRQALIMFSILTVVVCGIYPLFVMGVSNLAFSEKTKGSMISVNGVVVGSELIAQEFTGDKFFWSRPSAAGFNGSLSSGSNYALTNLDFKKALDERRAKGLDFDLLTTSGSGLDPHISPKSAILQVERVAKSRGIPSGVIEKLVLENTEGRQLGFLGEDRVNVLKLNIGLEKLVHE